MAAPLHEQQPTADQGEPPPGGRSGPHAQALSELFEQHNQRLLSFLMQRLGNEAEAKEVAQEAYVRLLQLDSPGAISFLRAYLYKTAANIAIDRIRHRQRTKGMEDIHEEELTETRSPDRELLAADQLQRVYQALREVDPRHRRAFLLHRFGDRNSDEIGRELNVSGRQVRTWILNVATYCRLRLDGLNAEDAKEQAFQ